MANPFRPLTFDELESLSIITEQYLTDALVEDTFRQAIIDDLSVLPEDEEDFDWDDWEALHHNSDELFDLCDMVEASMKGTSIG